MLNFTVTQMSFYSASYTAIPDLLGVTHMNIPVIRAILLFLHIKSICLLSAFGPSRPLRRLRATLQLH